MPPKTNYEKAKEKENPEILLMAQIKNRQEQLQANSYVLRRKGVPIMQHTTSSNTDCFSNVGSQLGLEVEFDINGKKHIEIFCNHCFKSGLVEQK